MGRKEVIKELKFFKKEISKDSPINKMIFFGSRSLGKEKKNSDIDLLLVSPAFRRKKSFNRGLDFYKHWRLDYPVDFLCYTPEEFKQLKKQISIVKEAVTKGIEI